MTEQLNERDMWLLNRGYDYGLYDGRNDSEGSEDNGWDRFVLEKLAESAPVNPNSARITELEREVERLGGLLDEVEAWYSINKIDGDDTEMDDILSRRHASGEGKERCWWCQGSGSVVPKGEGRSWDVPCPECGGKERGDG